MLSKIIKLKSESKDTLNNMITFQLAEANEIADLIIQRIDQRINVLKKIESDVDRKIAILEQLLKRIECIMIPSSVRTDRYDEIVYLKEKGFELQEISRLLDIPLGEVELFLNLKKSQAKAKLSQ